MPSSCRSLSQAKDAAEQNVGAGDDDKRDERGKGKDARGLHNLMPFLQSVHALLSSALRTQSSTGPKYGGPPLVRLRHQLAPRKVTYIKRHTGIIPIPIGGSTKGTTLAYGDWGLRIKGKGVRLTAKQLTTAEEVIKRKIKPIKGAKVYMRVFPHLPVCIKVCCVFDTDFTGLVDTI